MKRISIVLLDGGHIACGSLLSEKNQVPCQRSDERMKISILFGFGCKKEHNFEVHNLAVV